MTGNDLLEALPIAVYTTDAEGRITFFNSAAAELWGQRPELGTMWCGSWRMFWPDGREMAHEDCPMAVAVREGRPVRGVEAIAERPDGTRTHFLPFPTPLRDASGRVTGAINLIVDLAERKQAEVESARLAAIVASSDDAIVSKTLEGRVTTWNAGAARIFGYEPDEIVGAPITRIIPPELHDEEKEILARIRRGERVDHFDTVRVTKNGQRIDVSVTVSPMRDRAGNLIGASKVARDITERKQAEALRRRLFDELNHRVKNMLAIIQAIANQSLRRASDPKAFVASFNGRVQALARAHDLLVEQDLKGVEMMSLVRAHVLEGDEVPQVLFTGPRVMIDPRAAVQLALVLHELAANARRHGALSTAEGQVTIEWALQTRPVRELTVTWRETGVGNADTPLTGGFGTVLIERALSANGGEAIIGYGANGLTCDIRLPLPEEESESDLAPANDAAQAARQTPASVRGKRILVVEDEPLIAMELEDQLAAAGCEVVGTAANLEAACNLLDEADCDAVLIDAELEGEPADALMAWLARDRIPFIHSSDDSRPEASLAAGATAVLAKPFTDEKLRAALARLFDDSSEAAQPIPLRPRKARAGSKS